MDIIKNIFKNKINVLSFFVAFLGAFMLFPNYFEAYVMPLPLSKDLWMSLDPSWGIALNYVKLKNLTYILSYHKAEKRKLTVLLCK
jgi:hypothetical protein